MQIVEIVTKKIHEEKIQKMKEIAYNAWLIMYGSEISYHDYLVQLGLEESKKSNETNKENRTIETEEGRKEKSKQAIAKAESIVASIRKKGGR